MIKSDYPSVLLIYTGGTIGMIENPETGALEAFNFNQLQENVPELKRFNCRISVYQFSSPIDSSDMEPALWSKLVKIIQYNYDSFDGFVILHGTDTMAYTASALSFMLENLAKPVILTGSHQRSASFLRITCYVATALQKSMLRISMHSVPTIIRLWLQLAFTSNTNMTVSGRLTLNCRCMPIMSLIRMSSFLPCFLASRRISSAMYWKHPD